MKRAYGSQLITSMGEGTEVPVTPETIRKEFANLAEIIIQGGILAECGPVKEVLGVRLVTSYALTVDAPDITWAELHRRTKPDTAEVGPPTQPSLRATAERAPGKVFTNAKGLADGGIVIQGQFDPHRQNKIRYTGKNE